jgi:hypothetical protein
VLASLGSGNVRKLTGEQWVAFALAGAVFLLVVTTIVFDFVILKADLPPIPPLPKTTAAADLSAYKQSVEQYTALTNAAHERARNMFETFAAASLLPIFTGIVGFIFGRERSP